MRERFAKRIATFGVMMNRAAETPPPSDGGIASGA
jgi:hypothetical protein